MNFFKLRTVYDSRGKVQFSGGSGRRRIMNAIGWLCIVSLLLSGGAAWTESTAPDEYEDEPVLRLGRVSYLDGEVTTEGVLDEDWVEATINTPVMESDKLYTGIDSRAEVQLDDGVTIRLDEKTFNTLTDDLRHITGCGGNDRFFCGHCLD